jgi:hypothetical protein
MFFTVEWKETAQSELAAHWLKADSALRRAITAAAHRIDQELKRSPDAVGESREGQDRVCFEYPLGIIFDVDKANALVRVLRVWCYRRRGN